MFPKAVEEIRDGAFPLSGEIYWTDGDRFEAIGREGAQTGFELTEVVTAAVRRFMRG